MRLTMRLFLVVVLGAGILSACGSEDKAVPTDPPKAGGVFREGLVAPTSTDPARAQSVSERQMTISSTTVSLLGTRQLLPLRQRWPKVGRRQTTKSTLNFCCAMTPRPLTANQLRRLT